MVVYALGSVAEHGGQVTSAKAQYSGIHFLTTTLRPDNPFYPSAVSVAGNGLYLALGEGKQTVVVKLGDGSYQVAVGLRLPEKWTSENASLVADSSALRQWLVSEPFASWSQMHTDMIKHGDGNFRAWPLYSMPAESLSWQTVPGVTLIGDAAHLT